MTGREKIRDWLRREGRKQYWLAEQVPVDKSSLNQWLSPRGKTPRQVYLERLAEITGEDVRDGGQW